MSLQQIANALGQHGDPILITFGISHQDLGLTKVQILNSETIGDKLRLKVSGQGGLRGWSEEELLCPSLLVWVGSDD